MNAIVGQEIKAFWFNAEYHVIGGTVLEIVKVTKSKQAILLQTQDRKIVTWVSKVVGA